MAEIREIFLRIPKRYNMLIDRIAGAGKFPYLRMKDGFYWVPGRQMKHFIMDLKMEAGNLRKKGFFKKGSWKSSSFNTDGSQFVFMVDTYDPSGDLKKHRRSFEFGNGDFSSFNGEFAGEFVEAVDRMDPGDIDPPLPVPDMPDDVSEGAKAAGVMMMDTMADAPLYFSSVTDLAGAAPDAVEAATSSMGSAPDLVGGMGDIMEFAPEILEGLGKVAMGAVEFVAANPEILELAVHLIFGLLEILGSIDF